MNTLFMQKAIDKAYAGVAQGQSPFGACIVRDDTIITVEHNVVWTTCDITAHAEITAIRAACKKLGTIDLSGCTIYSTCEPCPMCFSACHWARIKTIVFGTSIADAARIGFNELAISNDQMKTLGQSTIEIIAPVMYDENVALFDTWYNNVQKRAY